MAVGELPGLHVKIAVDTSSINNGIKKANSSLNTFDKSTQSTERAVKGMNTALRAASTAFAGIISIRTINAIKDATLEFQAIDRTMAVAAGSAKAGADAFRFVSSEADRLGLNLRVSAAEFGKLAAAAKGTSLEGEGTRKIFTAVAEASTALGLTAEKTAGALNAIQQMISKGTVASEELRGQLGERLPGAFQIAAKAMGVTTAQLGKMLENGEVLAEDLLPRLATALTDRFGKAATEAAGGAQGAFNRLDTSVDQLMISIGESGLIDAMAKFSNFVSQEVIPNLTYLAEKIGIIDTNFKNLKLGDAALRLYETEDAIAAVTRSLESLDKQGGRGMGMRLTRTKELNEELAELTAKKDKLQEVIDLINNPPKLDNVPSAGGGGGAGGVTGVSKSDQLAADSAQKALDALRQRYASETELLATKSQADYDILLESLNLQQLTKEEFQARELEIKAAHEAALTQIELDEQTKREEIERRHNDVIRMSRAGALSELANLLSIFGQKSKAAALASLAIQKGLAIAETFASTQAASMRALAELGPIAGAPVAAAIETSGYTKMGLIAATGLAQAAGAGGGGSAGISAAATQGAQQSQNNGGSSSGRTLAISGINPNDLFTGRQLVELINQAQEDGARIITV